MRVFHVQVSCTRVTRKVAFREDSGRPGVGLPGFRAWRGCCRAPVRACWPWLVAGPAGAGQRVGQPAPVAGGLVRSASRSRSRSVRLAMDCRRLASQQRVAVGQVGWAGRRASRSGWPEPGGGRVDRVGQPGLVAGWSAGAGPGEVGLVGQRWSVGWSARVGRRVSRSGRAGLGAERVGQGWSAGEPGWVDRQTSRQIRQIGRQSQAAKSASRRRVRPGQQLVKETRGFRSRTTRVAGFDGVDQAVVFDVLRVFRVVGG